MPKRKPRQKIPVNLKSFARAVQKKVDVSGGLRAAEAETKIDHSTISRICGGRDPTVRDFFILLAWIGGKMPEW